MDKKQRSALRRFRRVHEFLTANQVNGTQMKLQVLSEVIREMSGAGETKDASDRVVRGETARQRALRETLRNEHMVLISRIARRVFGVPGMDVKFKLPPQVKDNQVLLDAARGMAQAAEAHTEVFVKQEGLPEDFVAQLRAATEALASALDVRVQNQRRRKTSRGTLDELVKRGIATVDVLDAIVKPRLAGTPDLLGTWNSVKRPIEPGGSVAPDSAEQTPTPPVVKVA